MAWGRGWRTGAATTLALLLAAMAITACRGVRTPTAPGSATAAQRAAAAALAVQSQYDGATGLFCTGGGNCWWWSANELTALSDYGRRAQASTYLADLATTYARAGTRGPQGAAMGPFLDAWNDDDGWWGLAWVAAYRYARPSEPVQAKAYLQRAEAIFTYLTGQWDTAACGGGLYQNLKPTHTKDAITNELFLSLAAELYQLTGQANYRTWALREWTWFQASGLMGRDHLVVDHLAPGTCRPQGTQYWTYTQGVILGGLATLSQDLGPSDPALASKALAQAEAVAECVTQPACGGAVRPPLLDARGILTEPCRTTPCTYAPAYQFKGVFVRNLGILNRRSNGRYSAFLAANARSLWDHRNAQGRFGFYWDAPPTFYLPADAAAPIDGAALDLLTTQLP